VRDDVLDAGAIAQSLIQRSLRERLTRFDALVPDPICSRPAGPSTRPAPGARR